MHYRNGLEIRQEIQSWIQWTRKNLLSSGDIPVINSIRLYPDADFQRLLEAIRKQEEQEYEASDSLPWSSWADDLYWIPNEHINGREELLHCFMDEMSSDPSDIATRFTALSFYHWASTVPSPMKEEEVGHLRSAFREDLHKLVGLLPAEACSRDWRAISWEIFNSFAVKDWDRAARLYDHAKLVRALDQFTLDLLRGQFNFLSVFAQAEKNILDAPHWKPQPFDAESWEVTFAIYEASLLTPETVKAKVIASEMNRIRDARNDLEKALTSNPSLPLAYSAMLARCYFAIEDFSHAADRYELLLVGKTRLARFDHTKYMELMTSGSEAEMKKAREAHVGGLEPVFVHRDFRPQIYYSAASAHRLAGQMQRAEEMLEGWSKEYPHHPDVFHLMAEVQAQEGRYEKAYEYLRKAVEADPALEEDLSTRIALTLGGTSRAPAELFLVVADFLKSHPSVSGLIDALHLELWPPYGVLDSESRERWRTAVLLMHYVPLIEPLQRQALLESAAQGFAKVVELELRKRVFGLFRVEVGRSEDLRSFATKGLSSEDTKVFCRYLLGAGKKERLSLGDMLCILDSPSKSGAPIWVRFHQWIQRQNPQLLERVSVLQRVVDLRNPAAHKTLSPDEANTMPRACRDVLTALLHQR